MFLAPIWDSRSQGSSSLGNRLRIDSGQGVKPVSSVDAQAKAEIAIRVRVADMLPAVLAVAEIGLTEFLLHHPQFT